MYKRQGINSFKLDGRDKPDEYNLEVMEAYLKESFDGNLLYLMQNYYPKNFQEFSDLKNTRKIEKLGVYIDNKKLNNFLTPFVEKKMCEKGCDLCLYCKKWSDEIVKIDKKNVDNYLVILENHIKSTMYTSGE